jgi:hypothetical protein
MKLLVRAVITGFGLSIGAALYKRVAKQLGLDEKAGPDEATRTAAGAAASDPGAMNPTVH